ncbi:uncharacterized protein N7446_009521 [Penicillium canescens]|uniref:Uncharacterized protein n=1 Tax=Penicillium canescens TaxID=5083 RepID=A0AAD6I819_PENCN|nr:uncharacterized protein N7446_009521 [Penicillium canescens]KAJ6034766.1 hypothetical protein N7460_008941 [Penicillium canescens]KAJ6046429.1 hypothetical protein N7444_007683 [Penicillium canescens]KAJ6053509.1 hypothetical protein N7446_009521 [Penicillium canescens]
MEVAPLTLAHTHARNAVLETRKANPVAASEEHDLAAGEFATAAQNSSDKEALRTLRLLETHHKKLAELLRFQHEHPTTAPTEVTSATTSSNLSVQQAATDAAGAKTATPTQDAHNLPPRLVGTGRILSRDKSSIASDLASARGIPSQPRRGSPASPTLSSQQAAAKMTEPPPKATTGESRLRGVPNKNRQSRLSAPRQPWSPPTPSSTQATTQQVAHAGTSESAGPTDRPSAAEEPLQRFYSAFGGLVAKVSVPLALAGLQVGTANPTQAGQSRKSSAEVKLDRDHATLDRSTTAPEPNVNKIFSRAALRSVRDGAGASIGNPAESFYVVPTTGGTMSYAGILTRAEKEARRNSLEDGDDDFVDAQETPSSPEMRHSGSGSRIWRGRRDVPDQLATAPNTKTVEEMQMENEALRTLTDTLSTRLHMWEVNAQSSTMALHQSLKMIHHAPSGTTSPVTTMTAPPAATGPDPRVKELEDLIRDHEHKLEAASQENDKLKEVLRRYRDRWEKLKEGAKTRRAEARTGDTQINHSPSEIPASPVTGQGPSVGRS